jgi:hypothetical protein
VEIAKTEEQTHAVDATAVASAAPDQQDKTAPATSEPKPKKKKTGFLHGVLGL